MAAGNIAGDALVAYKPTLLIPAVDQTLPSGSQNVALTAASMVAANGGFVTPQMSGAWGDGVHDDTVAIQAAITTASLNNKVLYFPAGVYMADSLVVPSNVILWGAGKYATTLRRRTTSGPVFMIQTNGNSIVVRDMTIDGNKANNPTNASTGVYIPPGAYGISLENLLVINQQWTVTSGSGQGILFSQSSDRTNLTVSKVINCDCLNNGTDGLAVTQAHDIEILGGRYNANTGNGVNVNDTSAVQTADTTGGISVVGIHASNNLSAGINMGPWISPIINGANRYGNPTKGGVISGCVVRNNGSYGVAVGCVEIALTGNSITGNSSLSALGGLLLTGTSCTVSGNTISNNYGFGFDCGGSMNGTYVGNTVTYNQYCGINVGATIGVNIKGNFVGFNGTIQIAVNGIDGPGGTYPSFPWVGQLNVIEGNTIAFTAGTGILLQDSPQYTSVINNKFTAAPSDTSCIQGPATLGGDVRGNALLTTQVPWGVAAASTVVIPDVWDRAYIAGASGTITNILTSTQNTYTGQLTSIVATNHGTSAYAPGTAFALTITGGGGTGATGTAWTDANGFFYAAQLQNHGSGYTSAPSISVTTPGGGAGAQFAAVVGCAGNTDNRTYTFKFDAGVTLAHGTGNLRLRGAANYTVPYGSQYITFYGAYGALEQVV